MALEADRQRSRIVAPPIGPASQYAAGFSRHSGSYARLVGRPAARFGSVVLTLVTV
jgi:hypothetical protein